MGKKSSSPPAAPDPVATANAQAAANKEAVRESALVNQINQVSPYGNLSYSGEIGSPNRTVTQTLSPAQQQMLDLTNQAGIKYGQTANQQLDAVSARLAQPLDFSSLGAAPTASEATRTATRDAILARLQPQFDRDMSAMETRLANQGIGYGSDAWKAAMDDINRGRTDARLAADTASGDEMARMFGLESAARNQNINEMVQQRQIPLNELAAMLTGSQVQTPNFVNTSQYQVNPADIMGAQYANYQGAQNAYNAQTGARSANNQGLYGLLGTGLMSAAYAWSDRRLKTNIHKLAKLPNGLNLYRFSYLWGGDHVGYMADEVRKLFPRAAVRIGVYDAVNYAEVPL